MLGKLERLLACCDAVVRFYLHRATSINETNRPQPDHTQTYAVLQHLFRENTKFSKWNRSLVFPSVCGVIGVGRIWNLPQLRDCRDFHYPSARWLIGVWTTWAQGLIPMVGVV